MTSTEPQLNGATNPKALNYVPATLEKPLALYKMHEHIVYISATYISWT